MDVATQTPGFQATVYASDTVPARIQGWKKVSRTVTVKREEAIQLDTARADQRRHHAPRADHARTGDQQRHPDPPW